MRTIFGGELSVRCWVVCAIFSPSIFEDRCIDFRKSMCRPSKIDGRSVDLRKSTCRPSKIDNRYRSIIDVPIFEDRCADLRKSIIDVLTFDDQSEIILLYTLDQNIDTIVVCELPRGFALQCFHFVCRPHFYYTIIKL